MPVKDFIPRPEGAAPDSEEHLDWLDTLRDRQCIDYQLVVSSVSSADETYLFSVSQNATRKVTVGSLLGGAAPPVTVSAATYTVTLGDRWIVANRASTITVTLPSASSAPGHEITIKTISADVVSASSNVVGQRTTAAATAILEANIGKWAKLVSDANNWVVMETNDNNSLLLE